MEKNDKDRYEVVYASDDNFSSIMGVSITSLLENNKLKCIHITILDSGISPKNKNKINELVSRYGNVKICFILMNDLESRLGVKLSTDRGSLSQFSRLFISSIFNEYEGRVLYLDCDTLIVNSINSLMSLDIGDSVVAALKDAFSVHYRKNIGLEKNDIMFNSGVMLIDLKKWRDENIECKILDFIREHEGKVQQGDQGILNAILSRQTYVFEPKYNLVSIFFDLSYPDLIRYRGPVNFYSEEKIEDSKKTPIIIHYTSSFYSTRPWNIKCNHKKKNDWLYYKDISPWKNNEFLVKNNRNILRAIIMAFPLKLVIVFASFFQRVVRPGTFKFK